MATTPDRLKILDELDGGSMSDEPAVPAVIRNPVLPGSHPDPSSLRVGSDYYVATSTFEWYPGVRIHHSRDLVRWRSLGGILDRTRLLDLTGCPDSGGVWAPSLTYVDGLFHLVFSNVSTYAGGFTDCPNYLITAPTLDEPWSDPILLHARGFDASLFHDGDDSWLVNLVHDWRPDHGGSAGLEATRYDRATRRLVGEPVPIELPPGGGWIEGPNLYRRGGWYYLITADGGTGYDHQVTVSRSRNLAGPYERDPNGPLITAKQHPECPLQKAGHGSLIETTTGQLYLAYLVARPHGVHGPCILGRETALALLRWSHDAWPTLPGGLPELEVPAPAILAAPSSDDGRDATSHTERDDFDQPQLGPEWSTLRRPATTNWLSLSKRPSHLRIRGGRSPQSLVEPSLVARRVDSASCSFEATIDFQTRGFQQLAGVTAYYNTRNWHFFYLIADDSGSPTLRATTRDRGVLSLHPDAVTLPDPTCLRLGIDIHDGDLAFRYDAGTGWRSFGPALDMTILSDEHASEFDVGQIRVLGFTGAFVGLWVWDLTGHGHHADFDEATYSRHSVHQHR